MWTVVQNLNIAELELLVELAATLGFRSQVFSLDIVDWGNSNWTERNANISVARDLTLERANELVELGLKLGVKVAFWNINNKYDVDQQTNLCPWPFERAYISSDMRVVPCCMIADPDTFEIRNSEGSSFIEIWNSKNYSDFRQSHLSGMVPKVCKGCYKQEQIH
jgi:pyrroloquinoline quinone biosynthesis protein E